MAAGTAAFIALGAFGLSRWRSEDAFFNPCLGDLPGGLASHELVLAAFEGLDAAQLLDMHAHLVGTGDGGSGIVLNPRLYSLASPAEYARRLVYLNAGCVDDSPGRVDIAYVERLLQFAAAFPAGAKLLLFAFERAFDQDGEPDWTRTSLYVPDAWARMVAARHPERFDWAASIHPYRRDAVAALEAAAAGGALALKWLPSAMGIDPAASRCDAFYAALARLGIPLVTHAGRELAVSGAGIQDYGNPLRLRRALEAGVRVVVAHCASLGEDRDLDAGQHGPWLPSFRLFSRLMDEPAWHGRLFGDLSAMTQWNRAAPALAEALANEGWYGRLLNGSDYPLPGVMPALSLDYLVSLGLLAAAAVPPLREIRRHNPLLFDFVLKRSLAAGGRRLPRAAFETRGFFVRPTSR